jgi:hypothetical protein
VAAAHAAERAAPDTCLLRGDCKGVTRLGPSPGPTYDCVWCVAPSATVVRPRHLPCRLPACGAQVCDCLRRSDTGSLLAAWAVLTAVNAQVLPQSRGAVEGRRASAAGAHGQVAAHATSVAPTQLRQPLGDRRGGALCSGLGAGL